LRDEAYYRKKKEGLVRCASVCATNVEFLEISLSRFPISLLNLFRSFEFWCFEFVSNFGFRLPRRSGCGKAGASDLVAATPRCDLGVPVPSTVRSKIREHLEVLL
jgi:hypothetical protein